MKAPTIKLTYSDGTQSILEPGRIHSNGNCYYGTANQKDITAIQSLMIQHAGRNRSDIPLKCLDLVEDKTADFKWYLSQGSRVYIIMLTVRLEVIE